MSAGQRANVSQFHLNGLLDKILGELLSLSAKGTTPLPTDNDRIQLESKLSMWALQLEQRKKQLDGIQKNLAYQAGQARSIPRDFRFRHSQSVRDRQRHVGHAQVLLNQVGKAIADVWSKLVTPTDVDIINRIHQLFDDQLGKIKDMGALQELVTKNHISGGTTAITEARIQALNPQHQAVPGVGDSLTALILLLRLFQMWILARIKK